MVLCRDVTSAVVHAVSEHCHFQVEDRLQLEQIGHRFLGVGVDLKEPVCLGVVIACGQREEMRVKLGMGLMLGFERGPREWNESVRH